MPDFDPSNIIFQTAASFVNQTGKHLFLTGKAGTGKTTFQLPKSAILHLAPLKDISQLLLLQVTLIYRPS